MSSVNSAILRGSCQAIYTDGATGQITCSRTPLVQLSNGNGTDQANRFYESGSTSSGTSIAASSTLVLNLSSLTDAFGQAIAATKIKGIVIEHLRTSSASAVTIGGGTNPVFGTQISGLPLNAGDFFQYARRQGYTVSSGSADRITITNSDSSNAALVRVTLLLSQ